MEMQQQTIKGKQLVDATYRVPGLGPGEVGGPGSTPDRPMQSGLSPEKRAEDPEEGQYLIELLTWEGD